MKRIILLVGMAYLLIFMSGCGQIKEVSDYPSDKDELTAENDKTENEKKEDTLNYIVYGSGDKSVFEVNAEKIADLDTDYPVYEVLPRDISDEDIQDYVKKTFDEGSTFVVLPYFLTQSDYVEKRITVMENRKEEYTSKGEEVPLYIEEDLTNLYDRRESTHLNEVYTIPYENTPKWIDLENFYSTQMSSDAQCRFCFVEGAIDGVYYRMEFTDYQNNFMIKLVRLRDFFDGSDTLYQMVDKEHLPFNKDACQLTEEEAVEQSEDFLTKWGVKDYTSIAVYPVAIYGQLKDGGQYPDSTQSGYICYFAKQVDGKTRPFHSSIENFTNLIPSYDNLLSIPAYQEEDWFVTSEIEKGTGVYRPGYEYLCVSVTDQGIMDCIWNSPSDVGNVRTDKTELLDFDKIDSCAQQYLKFVSGTDDYVYYWLPVIDRVELSMCRVTNDNTQYYMVPAWYYFIHSDSIEVTKESAVVVNAIDGSIIDVKRGGSSIAFTHD